MRKPRPGQPPPGTGRSPVPSHTLGGGSPPASHGEGCTETPEPQRGHVPPVMWHLAPDRTLRDSGLSDRDPEARVGAPCLLRAPQGRPPPARAGASRCARLAHTVRRAPGRLLGARPGCSSARPPGAASTLSCVCPSTLCGTSSDDLGGGRWRSCFSVCPGSLAHVPTSTATAAAPCPGGEREGGFGHAAGRPSPCPRVMTRSANYFSAGPSSRRSRSFWSQTSQRTAEGRAPSGPWVDTRRHDSVSGWLSGAEPPVGRGQGSRGTPGFSATWGEASVRPRHGTQRFKGGSRHLWVAITASGEALSPAPTGPAPQGLGSCRSPPGVPFISSPPPGGLQAFSTWPCVPRPRGPLCGVTNVVTHAPLRSVPGVRGVHVGPAARTLGSRAQNAPAAPQPAPAPPPACPRRAEARGSWQKGVAPAPSVPLREAAPPLQPAAAPLHTAGVFFAVLSRSGRGTAPHAAPGQGPEPGPGRSDFRRTPTFGLLGPCPPLQRTSGWSWCVPSPHTQKGSRGTE